jgi:endonuclease YncB( thermonuclease family)
MIAVALAIGAVLVSNREGNVLAGQASVIDGDTLRVAGQKVRLQGLAAPELDEPGGDAAKNAMIELVRGQHVTCELDGTTSYDRVVGICYAAGQDLAAELVKWGLARDCARYSGGRYRELETASGKGLPLPGYCVP